MADWQFCFDDLILSMSPAHFIFNGHVQSAQVHFPQRQTIIKF